MSKWTRRNFMGSLSAAAAAAFAGRAQAQTAATPQNTAGRARIKITDVRCAVIGSNPTVRIVTDQGISGYSQAENGKRNVKAMIAYYKPYLIGEDPTNIARIMLKIRRLGASKPWGAGVSAIEIALWDVAGQAAGLPVHQLLGGKIRDRVRPYGNVENNFGDKMSFPLNPQSYGEFAARMKEAKEGYTLVKMPIGFHNGPMMAEIPNTWYGRNWSGTGPAAPYMNRGPMTERGLENCIACVEGAKKVLGEDIGLAFDCGPGWVLKDAMQFARAVEPYHLAWLEDILTGDYSPNPKAQLYKQLTESTATPIHTGEELYLRENCMELIETQAVNVLGPDPEDVGGIAELKWIAEYADLHGILVAPHGIFDGLFGIAAQVHLGAACPQNYIAFEYAKGQPAWWYDIVEGLPDPIVKNGFIEVWDKPGLGVTFNIKAAKAHLADEDRGFFD